jgi:hypothetical protein
MGVGEEVKPHNWYKNHVERNPSSLESLIGDLLLFMMVVIEKIMEISTIVYCVTS